MGRQLALVLWLCGGAIPARGADLPAAFTDSSKKHLIVFDSGDLNDRAEALPESAVTGMGIGDPGKVSQVSAAVATQHLPYIWEGPGPKEIHWVIAAQNHQAIQRLLEAAAYYQLLQKTAQRPLRKLTLRSEGTPGDFASMAPYLENIPGVTCQGTSATASRNPSIWLAGTYIDANFRALNRFLESQGIYRRKALEKLFQHRELSFHTFVRFLEPTDPMRPEVDGIFRTIHRWRAVLEDLQNRGDSAGACPSTMQWGMLSDPLIGGHALVTGDKKRLHLFWG